MNAASVYSGIGRRAPGKTLSFVCDSDQIPTYETKHFWWCQLGIWWNKGFHFVIVVLFVPFFRYVKARRGRGLLMVFVNRPVITVLLNSEQNQELLFCDKYPKYWRLLSTSNNFRRGDKKTDIIKVICLTPSLPPPLPFVWPLTGYDRQYSRSHKMLTCAVLWLRDVKPLLLRQQHKGKRPSH